MEKKTCTILGVAIAVTNMKDTVRLIETRINDLRGEYICVSNVHTTVMAYGDEAYRRVQNNAALALPDGGPLSAESRKRGFEEAERVTGPDLMGELFARDNGLSHYFYGGTEETLHMLEQKLKENYPGIRIAGMASPPFRKLNGEEDAAFIRDMNESGADLIWIGLGAPKQENYMYDHRGMTGGLMIGVGAGFAYHAGALKRAPEWMQRLSLEWLYRLLQDPVRLAKRYVTTNLKFLRLVKKDRRGAV